MKNNSYNSTFLLISLFNILAITSYGARNETHLINSKDYIKNYRTNMNLDSQKNKENPLIEDTQKDSERDSIANNKLTKSFFYSIFTDFKGFKGDQPNGIIQSEFYFNFKLRGDSEQDKHAELFHNIILGVNLTKLGENLRHKEIYNSTDPGGKPVKHIHYIDLVRYNNFEAYIKCNILKIKFDEINKSFVKIPLRFYIDFFGSIISTGIKDTTLPSDQQEFNANSIAYGVNFKLSTGNISSKKGHVDFEIGYTPYLLNCQNNNFQLSGGPLYYPEKNPSNYTYQDNSFSNHINRFDFRVLYAPDLKDRNRSIFLRVMYHTNPLNQNYRTQGHTSNTFLQVQFGYYGSFSNLFPAK